ncbi:MAG: DUF2946 family protein [Burkholderiales bacterium]
MDDIVIAAMAKWPRVPHCYGWLGLDTRGNWYMRDDACQAAGSFANACTGGDAKAKGSRLQHEKLVDFIGRNYSCDETGQWYFQNGPQRVFVELACTPLVWRVQADFSVQDHTGQPAVVLACYCDEQGRLYLQAERGIGLVHSMDMLQAADAIEQGLWLPGALGIAEIAQRFAFVQSPQQHQMPIKK